MNNQSLLHKISRELKSLEDLVGSLEHENTIHQLDKDFALSKVRNLYDYLLQIEHGGASTSPKEPMHPHENDEPALLKKNRKSDPPKQVPESEPTPVLNEQEETQEVLPRQRPEENNSVATDETSKGAITDEISSKPEETTQTNPENNIPEAYQEAKQEETKEEHTPLDETGIVADKYTNKRFRHDNLAHQNQKQDLSTKLQSKPITDMNKAIGINDRFLFIRELFNGNKSHYHETVELLNNIDTYENAVAFIQDEFDWNLEEPVPQKLLELIRRKLQSQR